jgi:Sulfotransferase family
MFQRIHLWHFAGVIRFNVMTTNLTFESPGRSLFSQVCNGALAAFERLPRARRRRDVTHLLSIAERKTGLGDFGDFRFVEPMALLLESIERKPIERTWAMHLRPGTPERRFVLKAPAHLHSLEAIFAVYPDAHIIHTYRHPTQVVPSLANLTFILKSAFSDHVDPRETRAQCFTVLSEESAEIFCQSRPPRDQLLHGCCLHRSGPRPHLGRSTDLC